MFNCTAILYTPLRKSTDTFYSPNMFSSYIIPKECCLKKRIQTQHFTDIHLCDSLWPKKIYIYTVGSRFATVRFTTIHLYDPCPVRPITPDSWCVTVATRASFLHSVHLQLFSGVHVFLLFVSQCSSFKLIAIFPHPWRPSKRQKRSKNQNSWRHILSWCLLNHSLGFR